MYYSFLSVGNTYEDCMYETAVRYKLQCDNSAICRTMDGKCNNLGKSYYGAARIELKRLLGEMSSCLSLSLTIMTEAHDIYLSYYIFHTPDRPQSTSPRNEETVKSGKLVFTGTFSAGHSLRYRENGEMGKLEFVGTFNYLLFFIFKIKVMSATNTLRQPLSFVCLH